MDKSSINKQMFLADQKLIYIDPKFQISQKITQTSILKYSPSYKGGICHGLVMEFARHHISNLQKGETSDFTNKYLNKVYSPTENFLDRVMNYQKNYNGSALSVGKNFDSKSKFIELFKDSSIKNANILYVQLTSEVGAHAMAIKIDRSDANKTYYTLFDSNYGETKKFDNINDLADILEVFKTHYNNMFSTYVSMSIMNLDSELINLGIIENSFNSTRNSKYNYKLINALENKNFKETFKLNKMYKIDNQNFNSIGKNNTKIIVEQNKFAVKSYNYDSPNKILLKPHNVFELALKQLDETQLIMLINKNPYFDSSNLYNDNSSLHNLFIKLIMTNKLTASVIAAILNKPLPHATALTPSSMKALEVMKCMAKTLENGPYKLNYNILSHKLTSMADFNKLNYSITNNKLSISISTNDPIIKDFFEKIVMDINHFITADIEKINLYNKDHNIKTIDPKLQDFSTYHYDNYNEHIDVSHNLNKLVKYVNHVDYLHTEHHQIYLEVLADAA